MFYFISLSLSITMLFLSLGFVISKLNNISNVKNMGGLFFTSRFKHCCSSALVGGVDRASSGLRL